MAKYKVTGRYEVGGAAPGQVVELDPERVNVDELIRVGMVEPVAAPERSGQTRSRGRAAVPAPTPSPESEAE